MTEDDRTKQDNLIDATSDMIETYRQLIKVKVIEQTSVGASISIVGLLFLALTILVILFAGLGAAWWIGDKLENMKAGFFIVGGIFCLVLVAGLLIANSVIIPSLRNLIIRKIYEQH
jgi:uncharacterized BrkB/YihY/UPF0761 family membrane protein